MRRTASASAWVSALSAKNDGMCSPSSPRWCGAWLLLIPAAPASMASSTTRTISATSSAVASRSRAASPMTKRRTALWPTWVRTLMPTLPSSQSR